MRAWKKPSDALAAHIQEGLFDSGKMLDDHLEEALRCGLCGYSAWCDEPEWQRVYTLGVEARRLMEEIPNE